jgi:hypothetical protein
VRKTLNLLCSGFFLNHTVLASSHVATLSSKAVLLTCDFYYACCRCGSSEFKGGGRHRIPVIFSRISECLFSLPTKTRKTNCQKSIRLHNLFTLKCSTLDLLKVTILRDALSDPQHKIHVWHNIKMDVCKKLRVS